MTPKIIPVSSGERGLVGQPTYFQIWICLEEAFRFCDLTNFLCTVNTD